MASTWGGETGWRKRSLSFGGTRYAIYYILSLRRNKGRKLIFYSASFSVSSFYKSGLEDILVGAVGMIDHDTAAPQLNDGGKNRSSYRFVHAQVSS